MARSWQTALENALGAKPTSSGPLSGGCVGEVYRVELDDGRSVVAKVDDTGNPFLDIEGYMLRYLREHSNLPVPEVYHAAPELLVMEFLPGSSGFGKKAEEHAADLLAELHGVTATQFGLDKDTLIGGLHQPNPWKDDWVDFFREYRLMEMARQAHDAGRFRANTLQRIEKFGEKLDGLLRDDAPPSLLHGDVWSANVLAQGNRITGFVDPAVYYGHAEIELAFITMFHTFDEPFFRRYHEHRPIRDGFFDTRRDIYNTYPLLVHVRLFGGGYLAGVERVLDRHGC